MTPATVAKLNKLRSDFRPLAFHFIEALEREGIGYALGDTHRDSFREWEVYKVGRRLKDGGDTHEPDDWEIDGDAGAIVTRVKPGSFTGPHPYGLAFDCYPVDPETKGLMSDRHPLFKVTVEAMWKLAEELGIDALGHKTDVPGDQCWSGDPCHFQMLSWLQHRIMEPKEV